jgi:hypothetical protein
MPIQIVSGLKIDSQLSASYFNFSLEEYQNPDIVLFPLSFPPGIKYSKRVGEKCVSCPQLNF